MESADRPTVEGDDAARVLDRGGVGDVVPDRLERGGPGQDDEALRRRHALGQVGATSGVVETPSSTVVAPAEAGRAAPSAIAPATANRERFMLRFNTTSRRQLRQARKKGASVRRPSIELVAPSRLAGRGSELGDVHRLGPLWPGLLLI